MYYVYNLSFIIIYFNLLFQSVFSDNSLREFFFPRNPILHRVRSSNSTNKFGGEPVILDFIGLAKKQGYPAEEHNLITEDGYKLTIHRIPGSPKSPPKKGKPVVQLQHGAAGSSDIWILAKPKNSLAFVMADNGYDVWINNIRGNTYCRSHEKLSTLDPKFWNFSYHETGYYDIAATIDYSLNITGEKKIFFIAQSMGTTMSYVLLSTRPDYNEKIRLAVSFAPVALWTKAINKPAVNFLLENTDLIKKILEENDIYDVFSLTDNSVKLTFQICGSSIILQATCVAFLFLFSGSDPDGFDMTCLPDAFSHFPAGVSIKTLDHYKQNIVFGTFQQYDYECANDIKMCGKKPALEYDLKNITAPFALIYSQNDPIAMEENVFELILKLSNVVELYEIPDKNFNHMDYFMARDLKFLNEKILNLLSKY